MRKICFAFLLLFACEVSCAQTSANFDFSELTRSGRFDKTAYDQRLEDILAADTIENISGSSLEFLKSNLLVGKTLMNFNIDEQPARIENMDFTDCKFIGGSLIDTRFQNTCFRRAVFARLEKKIPFRLEGEYHFLGENLDMTDAFFQGEFWLYISGRDFSETLNYKQHKTDELSVSGDFSDTDLSNFHFRSVDFSRLNNSNTDNMSFAGAEIHPGFSSEQLCRTRNYRLGFFRNVIFHEGSTIPSDLRGKCFVQTRFYTDVSRADFTDTALIECVFAAGTSLTLEQIKQTWNYKTGRMDLIALPPELQKQVDAELAKEGRKPSVEIKSNTNPEGGA